MISPLKRGTARGRLSPRPYHDLNQQPLARLGGQGHVHQLIAVGGAGALYKSCVKKNEPVMYEDLGCEAMRKLTVRDMPLMVGTDADGGTVLK